MTATARPQAVKDLFALIREDHRVNSEGLWTPGFYAIAVYRCGRWALDAPIPDALRRVLLAVHSFASRCVRNVVGIEIPETASIGRRVKFAHQHGIVLHAYATVGDDCIFRQGVTLGARTNDPSRYRSEAPRIGDRVSFGVNAVVIGPVTVGDGARIGPTVLVTKDVPAGATVLPADPHVRTR